MKAVREFEQSEALDQFIRRVDDVEKVGSYFPSDNSIKKFKNEDKNKYKTYLILSYFCF